MPSHEAFANPSAAWRGKPFWSWNGRLDQAELLRQMRVLKDMGMGGFFMHSRTGLQTEYLGDEWMRLTNACADAGLAMDMEGWLYDEDRWPSGTAGGLVTQDQAFRSQFVSLRVVPESQFAWTGDVVAAFACDLDGVTYRNATRLTRTTTVDPKRSILVFTIEPMNESSFYNGFTYVDTMNRAAIDHYIELTHERYKTECGDRFGTSIKGIFTDEPHRGAVMTGFGMDNANRLFMAPWTGVLPGEFQKRFGYDLVDRLPELFLQKDGEPVSQVKWHYMELTQQLFLENFAKPIFDWCGENKLLLTGHVLHEDNLTSQAAMQGSLMRFYEFMHYPGIDVLSEGHRNYWVAKMCQSVARQLGQPWVLSELYGCTGWQMSFRGHKEVGDWQALFGVNVRCHHLSWYTMAGEAKRDYPASISYQSAWWPQYHHVETYFSRLGMMNSLGEACCDVLVLNPVESVWCQVHAGWAKGLSPQSEPIRRLEKAYADLFHMLAGSQIDFDYGDEEMLGRLGSVERDADGVAVLTLGKSRYRSVVVAGMTTIRGTSMALLERFRAAGGNVVMAGEPPTHVDALPSPRAAAFADDVGRTAFDRAALAGDLARSITTAVRVVDAGGEAIDKVFAHLRRDGDELLLTLMNADNVNGHADVRVTVAGRVPAHVEELDLLRGTRTRKSTSRVTPSGVGGPSIIPYFARATEAQRIANVRELLAHDSSEHAELRFQTSFSPSETRAFVITDEASVDAAPEVQYDDGDARAIAGPFAYALDEPNLCLLDLARYQIDGGAWQDEREILKIDRAVRTHFKLPWRAGDMVQPWFKQKFQPSTANVVGKVTIGFAFFVDALPAGPLWLALENPGRFEVRVNGHAVSAAADGYWVDPAFQKLPIDAALIREGANDVTLSCDFADDLDLEAIYLLGNFGVDLRGTRRTLTRLPAKLNVGDLAKQGLPFYTAGVTYHLPVPDAARDEPADRVLLSLPNFEAACALTGDDGDVAHFAPWPPYAIDVTDQLGHPTIPLRLVLTRRNAFGPFHQLPQRAGAYGPGNWVTEGKGWSDDHLLWPAGLLEAPVLVRQRRTDDAPKAVDAHVLIAAK